jgi:hypothetical protein
MEADSNRRDPYFHPASNRLKYKRFPLREAERAANVPLLARLHDEGYTEYFGFFHATAGAGAISPFARRIGLVPCVTGSFATRRPDGFAEGEIDCFKFTSEALALAAKGTCDL